MADICIMSSSWRAKRIEGSNIPNRSSSNRHQQSVHEVAFLRYKSIVIAQMSIPWSSKGLGGSTIILGSKITVGAQKRILADNKKLGVHSIDFQAFETSCWCQR